MAADEKKFTVYEWTIENFSSWRNEIHESSLQTDPRSNMLQFYLFRARYSNLGNKGKECMHVTILNITGRLKGDFSLICPEGSLIWTIPVDKEDNASNLSIGALPYHFRDLVALIRKNEAVHGDRLILRLRIENGERNAFYSMHSMIEVKTMSMKIALASILSGQPERNERSVITVEYRLNNGTTEKIRVRIQETPSTLQLILDPSFSKENLFFQTRMSVLSNDGSVVRIEEYEEVIVPNQILVVSDSLTRNEVVLEGLSILLQLTVFPSNKLKHLYTLCSPFVSEVVTNSASSNKPEHAVAVLLKDFLCLHQNEEFSDLQLHCEGVSFPVHKSILSARSPVFKTMFSCDMKEAASSSVNIVDIDAPTLALFLAFLYSGTVKDDLQSEGAFKLYYAADKYQVPTLKAACVSFLTANLDLKSVCDVLSLADQHRDGILLSKAHSFILKNYNKVLASEEWGDLMKRNSLLASKTLTDFARGRYVISTETAKN